MDHMRKRNHREVCRDFFEWLQVNPKNHYYDKFYIINYLELGKRWLDVLAEDFEDSMPTFVDSDEEEEEDSWCEWQEDNLDADETRVVCLFCDESFEKVLFPQSQKRNSRRNLCSRTWPKRTSSTCRSTSTRRSWRSTTA